MDLRYRQLERKVRSGLASPDEKKLLIQLACKARGHNWEEGWDDTNTNIGKGPIQPKGFYFYCKRCDPKAENRVTNLAQLEHLKL